MELGSGHDSAVNQQSGAGLGLDIQLGGASLVNNGGVEHIVLVISGAQGELAALVTDVGVNLALESIGALGLSQVHSDLAGAGVLHDESSVSSLALNISAIDALDGVVSDDVGLGVSLDVGDLQVLSGLSSIVVDVVSGAVAGLVAVP